MTAAMGSIHPNPSKSVELSLARLGDAHLIGLLSRDLIEAGLPWSWNAQRVARQILSPDIVVLVARDQSLMAGFAIMQFFGEHAHLNLFGVKASYQRLGVGTQLLRWLDETALTAGTPVIFLEVRASNQGARQFYSAQGFREIARVPRYYHGRETAVRMAKDLWAGSTIEYEPLNAYYEPPKRTSP